MSECVWFAVYISSPSWRKFQRWLTERAVDVYIPMKQKQVKRKGKTIAATAVPMFSGYAFIKVWTGMNINWMVLRSSPGYLYVISEDIEGVKRPIAISDNNIEELRKLEASGEFDEAPVSIIFSKGTPIEIHKGHLSGSIGVIEKAPKSEGEAALIEVHGMKVKIPVSMIRIFDNRFEPGRTR